MQLESDGEEDEAPSTARDSSRDNTQVQDMEEESSEESEDEDGCARMGSTVGQARPPPPGTQPPTPRINPAPPTQPQQPQPPPLPPAPDKVVVKKGYDPKQGTIRSLWLCGRITQRLHQRSACLTARKLTKVP